MKRNKPKTISKQAASKTQKANAKAPVQKQVIVSAKPKARGQLYPNPYGYDWYDYRPRYNSTPTDISKALTSSQRSILVRFGRDLFCSMPSVGAGINQKNNWAFMGGWHPDFKGDASKQADWVKEAIEYLTQVVYPSCNLAGPNFNFHRSLAVIGNAMDMDGECLIAFTSDKNIPKFSVYATHDIGTRDDGNVMLSGPYKGRQVRDGVILGANNETPIAFHYKGESPDQDYDFSAGKSDLLFEPEHLRQYRGIPLVGRALLSFMSIQDIESYMLKFIKKQSMIGIIAKTQDGVGDEFEDGVLPGSQEEVTANSTTGEPTAPRPPVYQTSPGGEMYYVNSQTGEDYVPFPVENPHSNTTDFMKQIEEKALFSIGWPLPLIAPAGLSGTAARVVEGQVRKFINDRQRAVKRIAKRFIVYALAQGMQTGAISENNNPDWMKWDFQMPGLFEIDSYYSSQADLSMWKAGATTMQEICAKKGENWLEVRKQTEIENDDLCVRAKTLVTDHPELSFERALDMISGRNINAAPLQTQKITTDETAGAQPNE